MVSELIGTYGALVPYLNDIIGDLATRPFEQIPLEAVSTAKHALIDYVGVAIAGSQHPDVRNAANFIPSLRPADPAAVLGTILRSQTDQAALLDGFAAHVYDYDDFSIINHPTAPVAPASFAVAEASGTTGADVIRSYVLAGDHVPHWTRVPPLHHRAGMAHQGGVRGSRRQCRGIDRRTPTPQTKSPRRSASPHPKPAGSEATSGRP
nr:MmgE/PrpD family protein [Rathayibacter sp. VKM Ac-2835]